MSFRPFNPADGPPWLPQFSDSIANLFRRIMPAPFRLKDYATADLPTAADFSGGLVFDTTDDRVSFSDGSNWIQLSAYDAAVASIAGLSIVQGDIIYGSGTDTFARLAKNTTATRYLANTGTSNNPAWAQVNLTNGVTGTLPVGNGGTGATTFTNNRLLTGNGTSAIVDEANLTFDGSALAVTGTLTTTGTVAFGGATTSYRLSVYNSGQLGFFCSVADGSIANPAFRLSGASGVDLCLVPTATTGDIGTFGNNDVRLLRNSTLRATLHSAGFDMVGEARCDSFRIDVSPTAETITPTHTITISVNGTNYKIPIVAA